MQLWELKMTYSQHIKMWGFLPLIALILLSGCIPKDCICECPEINYQKVCNKLEEVKG